MCKQPAHATGLAYHADAFMPGFFGVPAIRKKHAMVLADGRHGLLPSRAAVFRITVCKLRMQWTEPARTKIRSDPARKTKRQVTVQNFVSYAKCECS